MQQAGLQIRWHPWLPGDDRLQPSGRGIARRRDAQPESFGMASLDGVLLVGLLAWAYVRFGTRPVAGALMHGIKPIVIAIIVQALWRFRSAVKSPLRPMRQRIWALPEPLL